MNTAKPAKSDERCMAVFAGLGFWGACSLIAAGNSLILQRDMACNIATSSGWDDGPSQVFVALILQILSIIHFVLYIRGSVLV